MANEKASLLLYYSWYDLTRDLTTEQKGAIYDAIFLHEMDGAVYTGCDPEVKMALRFIFAGLDENREKYHEVCKKRRDAANKKYANASKCMQVHPNASNSMHKDYDNGSGYESEYDSDYVSGNGYGNDPQASGWTTNPTTEEVERYVNQMGYQMDSRKWCDHWNGWQWKRPDEWQRQVDGWAKREWPGKQDRWSRSQEPEVQEGDDLELLMKRMGVESDDC